MSTAIDYKRSIYAIRDLPTLPAVAQKVLSLADDDTAGLEKLAEIISRDQTLSARVLSLANSAYYGHRAKISTIQRAMVVIGMNMLKQISFSVIVCATIGKAGKDRAHFWKHSLATAMAASIIAKRTGIKDADVCFMAGLLHDIGRMILETHFPAQTELDHAEVGGWAAERWQLPPQLVEAIAHHHSLKPEHLSQPIVACVHAANLCAEVALSSEGPDAPPELLQAVKLSQLDFDEVTAELRRRRPQIESFVA
jgi:putative nucleotidyltransferase with HDIG domain